jgi:hypothetical protein
MKREPKRRHSIPRDDGDGFRKHEYEHAASGQRADLETWMAIQRHRDTMPHADLSMLDPGPQIAALLDGRDEGVLFMGPGAESVTARLTEPPDSIQGAPVVATIEVESDPEFVVGTIVIRMPDLNGTRIGPATVRVFDLKDGIGDPRLIRFSAVGPFSKYVWARICGRGRYAAIGLDSDHITLSALDALKGLALPFSGVGERTRLSVARTIIRSLAKARIDMGKRGRTTRADLTMALLRAGLPAASFDTEMEPARSGELDRLAERFAANPFLPEIQILMESDRERTDPWSG